MRNLRGVVFCACITLFVINNVYGQTIESIVSQDFEEYNFKNEVKDLFKEFTDAKPFDINGSVGLNMRSYGAFNIENRQAPFLWTLSSNININIYKIKIPLSFLISAQNQTYSHPFQRETIDNLKERRFTRIGVSPSYKWIKLHAGHRSMNFSPFTVANRTFLGGGIELTPGALRFAAFYGGMAKIDPQDRALFGFNKEVFNQKGLGFKVGYGKDQNFVDIIFFRARDNMPNEQSLNQDSAFVFPNQNAVLGINSEWTVFKKLQLKFELATSGFTRNAMDPNSEDNKFPFPNFILSSKTSTVYRKAINASINYTAEKFTIGAGYKRVEPEYRTLGAFFFNDDLEDYTVNFSFNVLQQKLRFNGSGGIQRNNLFNDKSSQIFRTIASLNVGYYHKALSLTLNYANNTSDLDFVLNPELDSLTAIVITQNASLTANYSLVNNKNNNRHSFALNFSIQQVNDKLENPTLNAGSQMINSVFSHSFSVKESDWRINSRINFTRSEFTNMIMNRYGLGLGLQKTLIKDIWSLNLNGNYFYSSGETIDNQTFNFRINAPITVAKKHRIDFGIMYMTRTNAGNSSGAFHELSGTLGYRYSFSLRDDRAVKNKANLKQRTNE